jgi:hypothetical protein
LLHPARWFESVLSLKLNGQKKNGISCQPVEKMQPDEKMAFLSRMFRLSKTWPDRFPKESPFFFSPHTAGQQRVKRHLPHNPNLKASDLHNADLGRQTSY